MDIALLDRLRLATEEVFAGRGILAAYVFGSRVSGVPREDSDVDVGYYMLSGREPLSAGKRWT